MKRSRFSGAQIIGILKEHQAGMTAQISLIIERLSIEDRNN